MSLGETRSLIASSDDPVTVRCDARHDDRPRWIRTTSSPRPHDAADAGGGGDGRGVLVSVRRRLVLGAGVPGRDGVYLCLINDAGSATARLLAANLTLISPCKHLTVLCVCVCVCSCRLEQKLEMWANA